MSERSKTELEFLGIKKNKSELIPINESVMLTAASVILALVFEVASVNVETQLLFGRFSFRDAY